jgi:DNA-binding XRE family transcriptional regulator
MDKKNINIKQIRENQRLTQTEFSKILDVSRSIIVKIESGEVELSKKMLAKLKVCFPFEFDKTESNTKYKSLNVDDLSNMQRYYWDNFIGLSKVYNRLKIICLAIKNIDNNFFDAEKLIELNKIEKAINILSKVVFHHGSISEEFSFKTAITLSNSEDLLDTYLTELSNKLTIKINNFDDLLLSDLTNIVDDFEIPPF